MKTLLITLSLLLTLPVAADDDYADLIPANERRAWELTQQAFLLTREYGVVAERTEEELAKLTEPTREFILAYLADFSSWLQLLEEGYPLPPGSTLYDSLRIKLNYLLEKANELLAHLELGEYAEVAALLSVLHNTTVSIAETFSYYDY